MESFKQMCCVNTCLFYRPSFDNSRILYIFPSGSTKLSTTECGLLLESADIRAGSASLASKTGMKWFV